MWVMRCGCHGSYGSFVGVTALLLWVSRLFFVGVTALSSVSALLLWVSRLFGDGSFLVVGVTALSKTVLCREAQQTFREVPGRCIERFLPVIQRIG